MVNTNRPNILFIFTDQHRLSALGCYGETPCKTPNIDRLAAEGVRFETAYTCFPVCSPARASIMTGKYPHEHGICSNVHNLGCSVHELEDRPELLSRRMQAAGYKCGYSGKWHIGTDFKSTFGGSNKPSLPTLLGFEGQDFPGHGGGGFQYPEYKKYLRDNGFSHSVTRNDRNRYQTMEYGQLEGPVESTVPYFLTEHTIALLDKYKEQDAPFFIWHNFWGPHAPYFAPKKYYDMYRDVDIPEWPNFRWDSRENNLPLQVKIHPHSKELEWEDWADAIRHYYAFTTLIDEQIGRMLAHLEKTGQAENTIVIFSADHGETLGSHGHLTDKGWQHFEEIQRIPLVVRFPEKLQKQYGGAGQVRSEWMNTLDIPHTILDAAGADTSGYRGGSLLPLLEGKTSGWRDSIFVEFNGVNSLSTSMLSCRHGDLKYGWNCSNRDELYDLAADPHEMNNVIDDSAYAVRADEMRQRILGFMKETGHPSYLMYKQSRIDR